MEYSEFIASKLGATDECGFTVSLDSFPARAKDWQRDTIAWALRKGRAAFFLDTGLGKTICQLSWAREVARHENRPVLIVAPLAVSRQTVREGLKDGIEVTICRDNEDVMPGINITNYERFDRFDMSVFSGVVLDESSILKSFMGSTKRMLVDRCASVKYKIACTATPSPNDHMEILNQAEWLGIIDPPKALSMWFINDTMNFGTYRLKRHAVSDFFKWVSTWAVSMTKPSDLGYDDDGYILPPLNILDHVVTVDETSSSNDALFRFADMSATGYNREKRLTLADRANKCAEIVNGSKDQFIVWCELNDEADALLSAIPDAIEVRGNDKDEKKERAAVDFADGKIRVLISKPSIFGFGLNFQNCHEMVFCGLSYSYESFYQSVRRIYRFGQRSAVNVHVVVAHTERNTLDVVNRKRDTHDYFKTHFVNEIHGAASRREYRLDYERNHAIMIPSFIRR